MRRSRERAARQRVEKPEYMTAWRKANPDKILEERKRFYDRHRERRKAQSREYSRAHPERERERSRRRRAADPELHRSYQRRWSAENRDAERANTQRRRARVAGATIGEPFTLPEIAERDGWRCHLCGKKVSRKTWSLDHLVPISTGGAHTRENVALAHNLCNAVRGNRGAAQLLLLG